MIIAALLTKQIMKIPSIIIYCLLQTTVVQAATTVTGTWNVSVTIPDNNDVGYTSMQSLLSPGISQIQSVSVQLTFSGGWDGDLYAYLVHDNVVSVLLNRPGKSLANPDGSGASGLIVTLSDDATQDIHTSLPASGLASGNFQPDGRTTDPKLVLDTDPRTAPLSVFNGQDASGSWTLFVADQSAGEVSTLQSWSLTVTGVPEPSPCLLGALGSIPWLFRRKMNRSFA